MSGDAIPVSKYRSYTLVGFRHHVTALHAMFSAQLITTMNNLKYTRMIQETHGKHKRNDRKSRSQGKKAYNIPYK